MTMKEYKRRYPGRADVACYNENGTPVGKHRGRKVARKIAANDGVTREKAAEKLKKKDEKGGVLISENFNCPGLSARSLPPVDRKGNNINNCLRVEPGSERWDQIIEAFRPHLVV